VTKVLAAAGFSRVETVKEQKEPHMDFPTVRSPNPEDREALGMAIAAAQREDADLVVATDPDADRIGIAARTKDGAFETFTGNQIGALLADYILSSRNSKGLSSERDVIIKTIVTSEMGRAIASSYGVETLDTLTGFKYIAEKIEQFSKTGKKNFIFGYEESNGYLAGDFVRDKDGVIAALLICETALHHKLKGVTLSEVLEDLYRRHGYFLEDVVSIRLEGCEGLEKTRRIMQHFRQNRACIGKLLGEPVQETRDYLSGLRYDQEGAELGSLDLPVSDVLYFALGGSSWVCIRPSGTEPKLKLYYSVVARSKEEALERLERLKKRLDRVIKKVIDS
jgi:phosphoglucomutase